MFRWLILIFITVPILELAILIKVGSHIGVLYTLLLIFTTALVGITLARFQGLQVFYKMQQSMVQGRLPTSEMLDGIMILCAAVVLLTPGLITDAAAFLFLIPQTRAIIKAWLLKRIRKQYIDRGVITIDHID